MAKSARRPRKQPATQPAPSELTLVVAAALDKKAQDLIVLDLPKGSAFTDFFVICTGTNSRQVQAIADGVEQALRQKGIKPALVEGYQGAGWVLLDYFDFIVHVFSPS